MNFYTRLICLGLIWGSLECHVLAQKNGLKEIPLPPPQTSGGKPHVDLMAARASCREISTEKLDWQTVSDILWSAWGFNREGKRTVPSAHNRQEMEVYILLEEGGYRYDAEKNRLIPVCNGDFRKAAGWQDFVGTAPLNILYVTLAEGEKQSYSFITAGCAVQNVYLTAAADDLACVVRASFDETELKEILQLPAHARVMIAQTVGKKKTTE